jgi:hypothetical protein
MISMAKNEQITVGGTFLINFVDETTVVAVLSGDLQGAVRGVIRSQTPDEKGVVHLIAEHAVTTTAGDALVTSDQATLTPVGDGTFFMRQTQTLVKGTGKFAGASGTLEEIGVFDMAKGQAVLRYNGRITLGA